MRYYLDTEFDESGYGRINLISIGVRCEDGREYYAVAGDGWDPKQVNPWVREHVLPFLSLHSRINPSCLNGRILSYVDGGDPEALAELREEQGLDIRSRAQIRDDLLEFFRGPVRQGLKLVLAGVEGEKPTKPQIWGYFADYDWVLFCQIFGRMIDLPKLLPMYCLDLKQEMAVHGITREELPPQETGLEHNALFDARWNERAHLAISVLKEKRRAEGQIPW